ncbi:MAG: glutathione S-transferase C-terminal domain-containing protein [Myxococcota bacterium]
MLTLYFLPMSSSLATRIALREAQLPAHYEEVDPVTGTTLHGGQPYGDVHELRTVPALRTPEGTLLTENLAVLLYVCDRAEGRLGPVAGPERYELIRWLSFVATELHARVFSHLLGGRRAAELSEHVSKTVERPLAYVESHLRRRDHLLDEFSVADAYLITALNWSRATPISLEPYPGLRAYLARGLARPAVRESIAAEMPLFREEMKRVEAARRG